MQAASRLNAEQSEEVRTRHEARGKLLPRDRVNQLLDPGSPFLELSSLAAHGMYEGEAPGAGLITGIGMVYMEKGDYKKATRYIKDGAKPNFEIFESHSYEKEPIEIVKYLLKSIIELKNLASLCDSRNEQLELLKEVLKIYKMIGEIAQEIKLEDEQLREAKLIEDNQNLFRLEALNLERYIKGMEIGATF